MYNFLPYCGYYVWFIVNIAIWLKCFHRARFILSATEIIREKSHRQVKLQYAFLLRQKQHDLHLWVILCFSNRKFIKFCDTRIPLCICTKQRQCVKFYSKCLHPNGKQKCAPIQYGKSAMIVKDTKKDNNKLL